MPLIEDRTGKFCMRIEAQRCLARLESPYQKIELFHTEQFGVVLVLDDNIQTSEADEFFYHEMLVHPAMFAHNDPRRVLVIGGGDGGALEEVLKHRPDAAVMVEIDKMVVDAAREYLGGIHRGSFDAPNVQIVFEDAFAFLADGEDQFDVVIVDCPDPVGPGEVLYTEEFYRLIRRRLGAEGVVSVQTSSPILQSQVHRRAVAAIRGVFGCAEVYLGTVPMYPCGVWSYTLAAAGMPVRKIARRVELTDLKCYQADQHEHYFALPLWYRDRFCR